MLIADILDLVHVEIVEIREQLLLLGMAQVRDRGSCDRSPPGTLVILSG